MAEKNPFNFKNNRTMIWQPLKINCKKNKIDLLQININQTLKSIDISSNKAK